MYKQYDRLHDFATFLRFPNYDCIHDLAQEHIQEDMYTLYVCTKTIVFGEILCNLLSYYINITLHVWF